MKKLSRDELISELGLCGEKIVMNEMSARGFQVQISTNKYDSEKDMIIGGKKVEVKTQSPFVKEDAFTFRPNQLRKCKTVDILLVPSVPHPKFKHYSDGWIYQIDPHNFKYKTYVDKKGEPRILIPIQQEAVKQLIKMKDEDIKELMKYSTTEYN